MCRFNMSHVHNINDLSEKVIYLYYYQTKLIQRNHVRTFLPQHVDFEVISFVNSKDI